MATIKDVARQTGLSVTTVSRALNGYDDVAETTRARVRAAARALEYHPNVMARGLQKNHTNTIGLVIPLVIHRSYDAFWLEFIGGVAATCAGRGVDLLVATGDTHDDPGAGFQRLIHGRRIDGLLVCDIRQDDPRISFLQKRTLPFVAFGRTIDQHDYAYLDVDSTAGTIQAIEHLIRLGHRRIAYLGVDPAFSFSHFRYAGYRQALAAAGLVDDPELVRHGLTEASTPDTTKCLLALPHPPTAIFCAADFVALAALKTIHAEGLSVPGDVSLATFDDSLLVQHANPPLTAVSQPNRRLGEEAAALLLDRIANRALPLVQRLVVPALVTRASTAPPRGS